MVGGVQHQQWWMLPLEKQVSVFYTSFSRPSITHTCRCTDSSKWRHKFVACSCFPLLDNRENSIGITDNFTGGLWQYKGSNIIWEWPNLLPVHSMANSCSTWPSREANSLCMYVLYVRRRMFSNEATTVQHSTYRHIHMHQPVHKQNWYLQCSVLHKWYSAFIRSWISDYSSSVGRWKKYLVRLLPGTTHAIIAIIAIYVFACWDVSETQPA